MNKNIFIIIIFALLIGLFTFQSVRLNDARKQYDIAVQNNKAYESLLDLANENNKVFQFTIEQLKYINDSTVKQLDSVRKELKIKDNKIKQMGKLKEYIHIIDTFTIHDTIFKDKDFLMDTCMGDKWVLNCIHMQYPNQISTLTSINTDLSVFLHVTRETIDPPCKTWLGRLFLRKHDVYNVTVIEHNPYANVKENKFVIINK